jgi:hypothetical protein
MFTESRVYFRLWNKYRPAILQLMTAAAEGPQQYKLYPHEFHTLNPREKGYSFDLHVSKGKAVNSIKNSMVAQDLLKMLQESKKASELMNDAPYALSLDKAFMLRVIREEEPVEEEASEVGS